MAANHNQIWSFGAVLYKFLTKAEVQTLGPRGGQNAVIPPAFFNPHIPGPFLVSRRIQGPGHFMTYGVKLLNECNELYSWNLLELVYRCLAYRINNRPSPQNLINEANYMLALYDDDIRQGYLPQQREFDDSGAGGGNVLPRQRPNDPQDFGYDARYNAPWKHGGGPDPAGIVGIVGINNMLGPDPAAAPTAVVARPVPTNPNNLV